MTIVHFNGLFEGVIRLFYHSDPPVELRTVTVFPKELCEHPAPVYRYVRLTTAYESCYFRRTEMQPDEQAYLVVTPLYVWENVVKGGAERRQFFVHHCGKGIPFFIRQPLRRMLQHIEQALINWCPDDECL